MPLTESLAAQARRELDSNSCPSCLSYKQAGQSFCRPCYFKLPSNLRKQLFADVVGTTEFAQAHDEAKDWLRINS